jgi:hypothetical protein
MPEYRSNIGDAVAAVRVCSPTVFSWFGVRSPKLPRRVREAIGPDLARAYLTHSLQTRLYNDYFVRGLAVASTPGVAVSLNVGLTEFVSRLSSANTGAGYWESGWRVSARWKDAVSVCKNGLTINVNTDQCALHDNGSLVLDRETRVWFPKENFGLSPGFYVGLGEQEFVRDGSIPIVRFYWNATPEGAVRLIGRVSKDLNRARLPFFIKALNEPLKFTRCDAVVLYGYRGDYKRMNDCLKPIYRDVRAYLKPRTPAFTKRIAHGVGLAEDPGTGESFGMHRCRLVAEGIVKAHRDGIRTSHGGLDSVERRFREEGVDLDRPFLRSGRKSDGDYIVWPDVISTIGSKGVDSAEGFSRGAMLRAASEIGAMLMDAAIWHRDRCTWFGPELRAADLHGRSTPTYRTLGSTLYSGTAGIAWFLAELYGITADDRFGKTALAAMRQTLALRDAVAPELRFGFFTGWSGIVHVAARLSEIFQSDELMAHSLAIVQELAGLEAGVHEFDLMSGSAGAIVALLHFGSKYGDGASLSLAHRLGEQLCAMAEMTGAGASWSSPSHRRQKNLAGFSHGTAGIATALLELFRVTADDCFRIVAEKGFTYEQAWFSAERRNWLDLRGVGKRGAGRVVPRSYAAFWCHGAPGIALSRARAFDILKNQEYRADAMLALETTRTAIDDALRSPDVDLCLCHGVAGNTESLVMAQQILADGTDTLDGRAIRVARKCQEHLGLRVTPPRRVPGMRSPGLMLGLAGIGVFLLRRHSGQVPSILWIGP